MTEFPYLSELWADFDPEMERQFAGESRWLECAHVLDGDAAVFVTASPLRKLVAEAGRGWRVYELMLLARPADLLPYVQVLVVRDAAGFAKRRGYRADAVREHLAAGLPVPVSRFDNIFWTDVDDEEPAYSEWHRTGRTLDRIGSLRALWRWTEVAQRRLRESPDPLVCYELSLMKQREHPNDLLAHSVLEFDVYTPPRRADGGGYSRTLMERYVGLLRDPACTGVALRYVYANEMIELAVREKLRRDGERAEADAGFIVSTFSRGDNGRVDAAWRDLVRYWDEGLGDGWSLMVDGVDPIQLERAGHKPWLRGRPILMLREMPPEAYGYRWEGGDGWSVGWPLP